MKLQSILNALRSFYHKINFPAQKYWDNRALTNGARSVLHSSHSEDEYEKMTKFQIDTLFPILKQALKGNEQLALDFGCGPGRFTKKLADIINGHAVGVDSTVHYLSLAPVSDNVEYLPIIHGKIPANNGVFDVIWICVVFGSILKNVQVKRTIAELERVAKPGAIIMLIENTTAAKDLVNFKYRSIKDYEILFSRFNLKHRSNYTDLGQRMSVFIGTA